MRNGVHVGCFPHKSKDRQMDRQEGQREMAKGHVEEVKCGGRAGVGQRVSLRQICIPSGPLVFRKEGATPSGLG